MAHLFDTLGGDPGGDSSKTPKPVEELAAEDEERVFPAASCGEDSYKTVFCDEIRTTYSEYNKVERKCRDNTSSV
jgi:hypothetical protein